MKKHGFLYMILLVILVMCTVVGCGDSEDPTLDESGTYTISYYLTPDSSDLLHISVPNSQSFQMSIPQRLGYIFEGLYDQPDGGTQIVNDQGRLNISMNKDLQLYAQWKAKAYTVYFDAGEGEVIGSGKEKMYEYGSNILSFAIAAREGYDFVGWYHNGELCSDENGSPISGKSVFNFDTYTQTGDVVIFTAAWEKKVLTVTFDYNDGSYNYEEMKVEFGQAVPLSDFPAIDTGNKELVGWAYTNNTNTVITSDLTNIKENVRVYGVWRNYKIVKFQEQEDQIVEIRVYSDAPFAVYTPQRHGYEFDGWYESKSFAGNPVENIFYFEGKDTYYAKWNMATYSINFVADADCVGNTSVKYYTIEDDVLLPMLTKNHYVFLGWCRNEDLSDEPMQLLEAGNSGALTLYAKFKGEDCSIKLNAQEGAGTPSSFTVEYGTIGTLPVPNVSDYAFGGWFLEDGTQFTDKNGVMLTAYLYDQEPTAVAKFVKKYYITVDIPYAAGTVEIDEYYIEGDQVILKFVLTDNGYTFEGFYNGTDKVATGKTYGFYMPASDVHLNLLLTPKEFVITFDVDGGYKITNSYKVVYNENFMLPIAYKAGFVFTGWSIDGKMVTDAEGKSVGPWVHSSDATLKANYEVDASGNGVKYIASREDFAAIVNDPSGKYVLVNDLDFTGYQFASVPELKGLLDGNGHTITGNSVALFEKISGTVKNLTIDTNIVATISDKTNCSMLAKTVTGTVYGVTTRGSLNVSGTFGNVGAIAGQVNSGGKILDCVNYAKIVAKHNTADAGTVGGIAGYTDNCTMTNCKNYADITGEYCVGGIVGLMYNPNDNAGCENHGSIAGGNYTGGIAGSIEFGGKNVTIMNLTNTASVTGKENTGGIAGKIYCNCDSGSTYTVTINTLNNSGTVIGTKYVAGIAGYVSINNRWYNMILQATQFTNTGDVTGDYYVGGLVGYGWVDSVSEISNSSSSGAISAKAIVGGVAGWLESIKLSNCSNAGTTLTVTGYYLEGTTYQAYAGGYVGRAYSIEGCTNDTQIQYLEKGSYVGGIAGYAYGDIINCTNNAVVSAAKADYVGGIVGRVEYGAKNLTMTNLSNNAAVTGKDYTGGIVGSIYCNCDSGSNYTLTMNALSNTGEIVGAQYTAGVVGSLSINNRWYNMILQATQFTNTGDVTGDYYVGGLVGYGWVDSVSEISNSSSSGAISAKAIVGGVAGWLESIKLSNCSNAGTTLTVTGYYLEGTTYQAYAGGYVGRAYSIEGCTNDTQIQYLEKGSYVGGIAGYAYGDIINCTNNAVVSAAKADYVGGIVGRVEYGAKNLTMTNLSNNAAVTGKDYTGGIVGSIYCNCDSGSNYTLTMNALSNTGKIVGAQYTAGVAGYFNINNRWYNMILQAAQFSNTGDVTGDYYVGGLVGYGCVDSVSELSESNSSGAIVAKAIVGGLAGWLENIDLSTCSNAGTTISATEYYVDGTTYHAYVGGYVGRGCSISNCTNVASITYVEKGNYVGGVAGWANGNIISCHNSADISASKAQYVGGVVGQLSYGAKNLSMTDLSNSGSILAKSYVGGIAGSVKCSCSEYTDYVLMMSGLSSTGNIVGIQYLGGIIGHCYLDNSRNSVILQATDLSNVSEITGDTYVGGLFGYAYTDAISQITESSSSTSLVGTSYVGGIAGWLGNIKISDCENTDTQIKAENKGTHIGGYVGLTNSDISNCSNAVTIIALKADYVGGIAGQISYGAKNMTLEELTNSAEISAKDYVGGIAGSINCACSEYTDYTLNLTELKNTGEVSGTQYVAGIAGCCYLDNGRNSVIMQASQLSNAGNATGDTYVGGLFGSVYSDGISQISESSSSGTIKATSYLGGIAGKLENISLVDCENAGTQIKATSKGTHIGGYVGFTNYNISGCSNAASISAAKSDYVGGIAGQISYGGRNVNLEELTNTGDISGKENVGGIVGSLNCSCSDYTDYILTLSGLTNSGSVTGTKYTGGIAGYCYLDNGRYTVRLQANSLSNSGKITGDYYVGGLFGYAYTDGGSEISESSSSGAITAKAYIGGLGGWLQNVKLNDCSNAGTTISATGSVANGSVYDAYVGGYAGRGYIIQECSNSAHITYNSNGRFVGGIAGYADGDITDCKNYGMITAAKADYVGGIVGQLCYGAKSITLSNLYNAGKVAGKDYVGGVIGSVFASCSEYTDYILRIDSVTNARAGTVTGSKYVAGLLGHCQLNNGRYNMYMIATLMINQGEICGVSEVGGLIGYFYSDGASTVADYHSSGSVAAEDRNSIPSLTVANSTNLTIS